jgi:hypothetical protein
MDGHRSATGFVGGGIFQFGSQCLLFAVERGQAHLDFV